LKRLHTLSLLLVIFCALTLAKAQTTDATISGEVVDPSGKVIINADVEILNEETGLHYSGKTNGTGIYTASILPPGQYRVQVSKDGFKTIIKPGIILNVQSAVALNFTLPVGAASESVTVEASGTALNTRDASVGTVIDRKFVENIPLNGRSFQDLISMTPGVSTQSPQSGSVSGYNGDFTVNGQRTESNYYMVDGVSANSGAGTGTGGPQAASSGSIASSTALGTTQSLISVDALQEFRVQSSTYSAEFGRTPGGQFSLMTRSGTNELHGSAYEYLRNDAFDASDWFNDYYGSPKPALRQSDFGVTLGGPIRIPTLYNGADRSFFFGSYEGLRLTQPQAAAIAYVPDVYMREESSAALTPVLNSFPLPNGLDYGTSSNPSLAQFIKSYSLPSAIDSTSIRLDQQISPKLSLFFRFGYVPSSTESRALSDLTVSNVSSQSYTLGANSQLSSSLTNEFRLGYSRTASIQSTFLDSFGGAQPANLAAAMGIGGYANAYPEALIYIAGIGSAQVSSSENANYGRQWNLLDTTGIELGRHHLKAGIDYRRVKSPLQPPSPNVAAYYYSAESVISNSADYLGVYKNLNATPVFNETAAFFQDTWQMANRLSLDMGIRWEVDPPPTEAHGDDAYTIAGDINHLNSLALAPQGTPLWRTTWYNFAPRLGVAWQARTTPNWETVVRAGGGVFFDTGNQYAAQGYLGVGFGAYQLFTSAPIPVTPSQLDFQVSAEPPYTGSSIFAFSPHLQLPYTLQWNVSIQQALSKQQTFTLSYVGANGRRLLREQDYYVSSLNPNFDFVAYTDNGVTSNYQALQFNFQRIVTRGVQALASYTWSHSIDFGSTYAALPLTRGDSDFDLRDNFVGGVSWELPTINSGKRGGLLANGWGIDGRFSARTAYPITLQGNFITDPATGSGYYGNVNLIANEPVYLYGHQYPGGRAVNSAAFSLPGGTGLGNAPRNFVRGFGAAQANLALRREFRLHDYLRIQARAEAFNLANHPNFGYVDPYFTDATFGQATKMLNQSLGTVSPQYQQGGARSIQIALKFVF
jgi:hypothetical protein